MTTPILKLATSVLAAHASQNKMSGDELTKLLDDLYTKMVDLELSARARLGVEYELIGDRTQHVPASSESHAPIAKAAAVEMTAVGMVDTLEADRPAPAAPAAPAADAAVKTGFDAEAWLNSLPERTSWAENEARSSNANLSKGWVGVYDSGIICLIDGKSTRLLTSHLKRNYKDDPRLGTLEAYRSHFRLPPNYPNGCAEFKDAKSKGAFRHNEALKAGEATREPATQKKIDKALSKSGLDLSKQVNPQSRPGLFPFTVVCLECSAKVPDIAEHLRSEHNMSLQKYLTSLKLSSRFPARAPDAHTADETQKLAAKQITSSKLKAADQVDGSRWPGVFASTILCLDDGAQVADLGKHLADNLGSNMTEYRLKYSLPDDFPAVAPGASLVAAEDGGRPKRRMARASTESQAIKTRNGMSEVQVTRKPARKTGKVGLKLP